jgi:uncharacterized repeat protein (TIGR01451 family)
MNQIALEHEENCPRAPRTENHREPAHYVSSPRWWRMAIIAIYVLILCSCQSTEPRRQDLSGAQPNGLPPEAFTGAPDTAPPVAQAGPPGMEMGVPLPYTPTGPWSPPGISTPWPQDEYLRDGGHLGPPIQAGNSQAIRGLQMEDTVAQFKDADGQNHVEPSNKVYMYSPRFGAVRQVVNLQDDIQIERSASVHEPLKLLTPTTTLPVLAGQQNIQARNDIGTQPPNTFRSKLGFGAVSTAVGPKSFHDAFKAYENLSVLRYGVLTESETAWLARGNTAAVAWSGKQAVQVVLNERSAMLEKSSQKAQATYTVDLPSHPRLRIVKVASTPFAEPGDEVDFTLRFDNTGDQVITKVTIVDSLSTRLEYTADSAQCSRAAKFSTQPNEGGSLVVRCELLDALEPGHGGVVRFHCRVR